MRAAPRQVGVVDRLSDRDAAELRALAPALAGLLAGARRAEEVVRLQERMRASFSTLQTVLGEVARIHHAPGGHGLLARLRASARKLFQVRPLPFTVEVYTQLHMAAVAILGCSHQLT